MTVQHARRVDICICTFRRPYLAETLQSIARIDAAGCDVEVIISDNDTEPSARAMVEEIAATFRFPIRYLHTPAANISLARNACLEASTAGFIAFVDDDETVSEGWLRELMRVAERDAADAVLGPVKALYDAAAPTWMAHGDFHSTAPVVVDGAIRTGYTCNVLIRWSGKARDLRFDLGLGKSGGEDTDFFYRLSDLGGRIAEAPDAWVYEPVPASRARMSWLLQRRLRAGQTHGTRLRRAKPAPQIASMGLASVKVAYCLAMATATAFSPVRSRRNLLRATMHAGVVSGIVGGRQAVLYGEGK